LAFKGWDSVAHREFNRIHKEIKDQRNDEVGCAQAEFRFQSEATKKHAGSSLPRRVSGEVETGVEEAVPAT
jgi:hypothetical protein